MIVMTVTCYIPAAMLLLINAACNGNGDGK